ncbi:33 kDa chaperonin [Clarias magur]|uniref:33 kDa chaperonin n=1 Tax=Clarias magur TaxID=1594786 RepID=A0A8J4WZL1_CLAMG|nr:33 kDa chaperonin [Clarias magur]
MPDTGNTWTATLSPSPGPDGTHDLIGPVGLRKMRENAGISSLCGCSFVFTKIQSFLTRSRFFLCSAFSRFLQPPR